MATLVSVARDSRVSGIGDATNRWPAVHRMDGARVFRLAVDSAPTSRLIDDLDRGHHFDDPSA